MKWFPLCWMVACSVHRAEHAALSDPSNAEAWEKLGNAYRTRLKSRRATEAYATALQIDPSREHLRRRMSRASTPELRDAHRLALRSPLDDEAWGDLGDIYQMLGDPVRAQEAYLRAFRLDPTDSEWHEALIRLGQTDLVLSVLSDPADGTDDESIGDFADLLETAGRHEEACEHWRRAAELDPSDSEWIERSLSCGFDVPAAGLDATAFSAEGEGEVSWQEMATFSETEHLDDLVRQLENDGSLLTRLGQAYLRARDLTRAEENLWAALLLDPADAEALDSYLIATGKTKREVLERLWTTFPENDELAGALADHYLDLGLRDRARDLYGRANTLDPQDPEWQSKRDLLGSR